MAVAIGVEFILALAYVKIFDRRRLKGKLNAIH